MKHILALIAALLLASPKATQADEQWLAAAALPPLSQTRLDAWQAQVDKRTLWDRQSPYNPLGQLDPMALALAYLESNTPLPPHARWHLGLYLDPENPEIWQVDALMFNHGPRVRRELVEAYGRENVADDRRDALPHQHWRLQFTVMRGAPVLLDARQGRPAAIGEQCLRLACLSAAPIPTSPLFAEGQWQEVRPHVPASGAYLRPLPGKPKRMPLPHLAQTASRALLGEGQWEAREGERWWRDNPVAEMVLDIDVDGQDSLQETTLCQLDLADDSLKSRCVHFRSSGLVEEASGGGEIATYTACRRGRNRQDACL